MTDPAFAIDRRPVPSVSVCFPAYNEENTVGVVVEEAAALLASSGVEYELLVCNDGSTDGTGAVIDALAARLPHMRAVHHAANAGIRDTFEHLYSLARHEFVFLNSVDQQWETRILFDMLPLTREFDVVVASRTDKQYGLARSVVSWGFNAAAWVLFGVRTFDAGAVKLMRREIIERFDLVSRSPFTEAERLIRAAYAGYRITAYPVDVRIRRSGRARGADPRVVVAALCDVGRVWWDVRAPRARPSTPAKRHGRPA
jgi:glycosyltransferase involved in cell wall biosynthesis